MADPVQPLSSTKAGTAGGFLLVVLMQLNVDEIIKSVVLAAIGATVSFSISLLLKWVIGRFKKK